MSLDVRFSDFAFAYFAKQNTSVCYPQKNIL